MSGSEELVLYRNDKAIVLYSQSGTIKAVSHGEGNSVGGISISNLCPLCGSTIETGRYTYIAQAYFYLLQQSFQDWQSCRNSCGLGLSSTRIFPEDPTANYCELPGFSAREPTSKRGDCLSPSSPGGRAVAHKEKSQGRLAHSNLRVGDSSDFNVCKDPADDPTIETPKHIPQQLLVTGYYKRFFVERHKLGSGSFGHVYYCIHVLDDLVLGEYAVKKLAVGDDMGWLRRITREVKIREHLRHKNIVDYNHSWLEMHRLNEFCPFVPWLFILMEYCNGGDLEKYINSVYGFGELLAEIEIWVLFSDILSGLCHLHRNGILYRDLKPSNILLHSCSSDDFTALLSDFGTAEVLAELCSRSDHRQGFTGTVEYTAPELLETDENGKFNVGYDTKSDIWSLGIILYFLSYGKIPYYNADPLVCRREILSYSRFELPSEPPRSQIIQMLILALTRRDPSARPTCETILGDSVILQVFKDQDAISVTRRKLASRLSKMKFR